jgi:Undecaprenyl-phosphate glucose phosphotransferase
MLKKHGQVFLSFLVASDLLLISISWVLAYLLRFEAGFLGVAYKELPTLDQHLPLLIIVLLVSGAVFNFSGLYRPKRISTLPREIFEVVKAVTFSIFIFVFLTYFFKEYRYSRLTILYFWGLSAFSITVSRYLSRRFLRTFRRKGYNLRHVLIVGEGQLGQQLLHSIHTHPEMGLKVTGFLSDSKTNVGRWIGGIQVIGTYEDLHPVVRKGGFDQVFIAIPFHFHERISQMLTCLRDELVTVRVVSDLYDFVTLRGGIEELDGLPIVSIQDTPLLGWGRIAKRGLDVLLSLFAIAILSPLMLLVAGLIKATSPGPVLFRQARMGFDGMIFDMLKFRSMIVDAEKETGSVWAKVDDPRRTSIGKLLRKTSLDELPQLFNVLKGEMSLVGPRPERPELIEEFKYKIPKYMLRHKIKAGMTGWAQVNGWRGNTSLEKRIEHDLHYIENWSISLDIQILFLTVLKGSAHKHAY